MRSLEKIIDHFIQKLIKELPIDTKVIRNNTELHLTYNKHNCSIDFYQKKAACSFNGSKIPIDLLITKPNKLIAIIQAKLQYNRVVYARTCQVRRIDKKSCNEFLDAYHLMSSTNSAYCYGLFDSGELVAVASFSKGRKMDRLKEYQRSYELIRTCSKEGIRVSGGISKLLTVFVKEMKPGDIMTYIDKQFGEGNSYYNCGFKKHSETEPQSFLINKKTFERNYLKESEFDTDSFYLSQNCGNIKLVYTIEN